MSCGLSDMSFLFVILVFFFFFNDTATTEIYSLSLHDALPICWFFAYGTGSGGNRSDAGMPVHENGAGIADRSAGERAGNAGEPAGGVTGGRAGRAAVRVERDEGGISVGEVRT